MVANQTVTPSPTKPVLHAHTETSEVEFAGQGGTWYLWSENVLHAEQLLEQLLLEYNPGTHVVQLAALVVFEKLPALQLEHA